MLKYDLDKLTSSLKKDEAVYEQHEMATIVVVFELVVSTTMQVEIPH